MMKTDQQGPRLWTRNYILICIVTFLIFCAFQMLNPVLPLYSTDIGIPKKYIGGIL